MKNSQIISQQYARRYKKTKVEGAGKNGGDPIGDHLFNRLWKRPNFATVLIPPQTYVWKNRTKFSLFQLRIPSSWGNVSDPLKNSYQDLSYEIRMVGSIGLGEDMLCLPFKLWNIPFNFVILL